MSPQHRGRHLRVVDPHAPMPAFVPAAERPRRRYVGLWLMAGIPAAILALTGFLWASYYVVRALGLVLVAWQALLS